MLLEQREQWCRLLQVIKTGRRKLPGQSHLQEETPLLLKQLPPSPNAESTSGLSFGAPLLFNKLDPDPKTGLFISPSGVPCAVYHRRRAFWCLLDVTATPCGSCVSSSGGAVTCRDLPKTTRSQHAIAFTFHSAFFVSLCYCIFERLVCS